MHTITEGKENIVRFEVTGKLTQDDYDKLIPSWKATIARHGKVRLLFAMKDFHGWEPGAAWDDLQFDRKHGAQVERVAMVGGKKWQEWVTKIASWFVGADVRYFDLSKQTEAEKWVKSS